MHTFNIKTGSSVNDIYFGLCRDMVRNKFNLPYKLAEHHLQDPEIKELVNQFIDKMVEISGHSRQSFLDAVRTAEEFQKERDFVDYYEEFHVCYDSEEQFEAIEFFPGFDYKLIVDGKDYSDFKIENLRKMSDDFIYTKEDGYTSYSKQIAFRPSAEDKTIAESICFGCDGYFYPEGN